MNRWNVAVRAHCLALTVLGGAAVRAQSPLILYDGFDYPTTASTTTSPEAVGDRSLSGEVLEGGPAISFTNAGGYQNSFTQTKWSPININAGGTTYNTAGDVDIVAGSLSYPGLASSVGNSVAYGGDGYSPRLIFSPITAAGGFPDAAVPGPSQGVTGHNGASNISAANSFSGSVFYSALVQVNSLPGDAGGDPIISFHGLTTQGATPTSAFFAGTYVKANPETPGTFFLGVTKGQSVNGLFATYDSTPYALGTTFLLVAEWEFVANSDPSIREGNDVARLYINPTNFGGSAGASGSAAVVEDVFNSSTEIANDLPLGSVAITSVVLHQRRSTVPSVVVDEIRVGTTFASVTPGGDNADFDADGDVDGADFLIWQRGIGGAPNQTNGNANGDGAIDGADLAAWKSQFGASSAVAVAAVPEPASAALFATATACLATAACRRRVR